MKGSCVIIDSQFWLSVRSGLPNQVDLDDEWSDDRQQTPEVRGKKQCRCIGHQNQPSVLGNAPD
jgi:hypothetical protein